MNIPNVNAFANFIRTNNLMGLCPEAAATVSCLEEYSRMCGGCGDKSAKEAKKNSCLQFYVIFVSKSSGFKNQLFQVTGGTVITFYDDQRFLGCINR